MAKPRIDYKTREEHESRLWNIVLHSADALPDRVVEYIRAAAEGDRWRAKEQILKTFVPLVAYLPAEYVNFALAEMVLPAEERDWTWDRLGELGIDTPHDYHPPAHVQGPFLRLLRTHEDEGLRLIHGLTNAATANWRQSEQGGGAPYGVRTRCRSAFTSLPARRSSGATKTSTAGSATPAWGHMRSSLP